MADVDDFKQINDSYGHVTGDGILNRVAARIKQSLRVYDSVGRYGGDEFLVILPNCGKEQTLRLAERVRRGVSAEPFPISGLPVVCTISLGVTAFPGCRVPQNRLCCCGPPTKPSMKPRMEAEIAPRLKVLLR